MQGACTRVLPACLRRAFCPTATLSAVAPQVKAAVYGYAGDLSDDRITPREMADIVSVAAARLDDDQKASLDSLLRRK